MNKVLIIHLSQIFTALQYTDDVRVNNVTVNLKDRPEFNLLLPIKNKRSNTMIRYFDLENLIKLLRIHDNHAGEFGSHPCRAIFQVLTGVRFANTDVRNFKATNIQLSTHNHMVGERCSTFMESCCMKIKIVTKTGVELINVPPFAVPCFNLLRTKHLDKSSITLNKEYNKFLKTQFNRSSHDVRRCMCNSTLTNRNTGWRSTVTMSQHYINRFPLQADMVYYLEKARQSIESRRTLC